MAWPPILKTHCETGHFSHGYLLVGEREKCRVWARQIAAILLDYEEPLLDSHPDFSEQYFDVFAMNESRDLKQRVATTPILGKKKVFVFGIASFSPEAVNSLLKILEEPPETCHFFFLVSFFGDVPSVLRSRLVAVVEKENYRLSEEKHNFYEKFLKAEPPLRLKLVKNISADKRIAFEFLNELEVVLSEQLKKGGAFFSRDNISLLGEIRLNRQFLLDRASLPKMILEHFALTLPRLK